MRNITIFLFIFMLGAGVAVAQGFGDGDGICNFVDEDGDGYNDLAPDADGDGIPNGQDPDYVKPEDGTGNQYKYGQASEEMLKNLGTVMGIAHKAMLTNASAYAFAGEGGGFGYGLGDGTGTGVGPGDGTGFGPGDGTGDCDGTGTLAESITARRGGRR
jgi:hypothetical protein